VARRRDAHPNELTHTLAAQGTKPGIWCFHCIIDGVNRNMALGKFNKRVQ
jgi:hypothetical protein